MNVMTPDNPSETSLTPETRPAARPAAAPAGTVRVDPLNLSRRPFLNSRPVVRVSLLLWLLGLLLLLVNVSLFWGYLSSSKDMRAEIAQGEQEIDRRRAEVRDLETRLDRIDLDKLNAEILFLNSKIQERTFSWNLLLDRLAEVLPNDVRLNRLTPLTGDQARERQSSRGTRRARPLTGRVELLILGEARNDEALFQFVDNLEAHPAFTYPNPSRDEQSEGNLVKFDMSVQYIPGSQSPDVVIEEVPVQGAPPPPGSSPGGRP